MTRYNNHVVMNKWMRKFFMYLDRYYVKHHSLPTLHESGLKHFKTLARAPCRCMELRVLASPRIERGSEHASPSPLLT